MVMGTIIMAKGGKRRKTMKVGRGPMLRPRKSRGEMVVYNESNDIPDIKASFATPELLARDYIKALDEIKNVKSANSSLIMQQRKNRILFFLLIMMGLFATYNTLYIPAVTDILKIEESQNLLDIELSKMGYNYIEKTKIIKEHVEKITKGRFYFGSGESMTANEILEFLKNKKELSSIITKLENLYKSYIDVKLKIDGTIGSLYDTIKSILKGDVKGFAMLLGAGTLGQIFMNTFGFIISPIIGISSYYITSNFSKKTNTQDNRIGGIRIEVNGDIQYVSPEQILQAIDLSKESKPLENGYFDTFLAALFAHEEQWTTDESTSISSTSVMTTLTNNSINSLDSISYNGYGTEWDNMAQLLSQMFDEKIEKTVDFMMMSFSTTYLGLLTVGKQEDLFNSESLSVNTNNSGGGYSDTDDSDSSPQRKYRKTEYNDSQFSELTYSQPTNSQNCDDVDLMGLLNNQIGINDFIDIINIMNQKAIYNSINKSIILNNTQKQMILSKYDLIDPCLIKNDMNGGRKKHSKKIHKTRKHSKKGKKRTHKKRLIHRK